MRPLLLDKKQVYKGGFPFTVIRQFITKTQYFPLLSCYVLSRYANEKTYLLMFSK